MKKHHFVPVCILLVACHTLKAHATVVRYTTRAQWEAAVNNDYRTIDFTGFPSNTIITTQYSSVGVTFAESNSFIVNSGSFINDGSGLENSPLAGSHITANFAAPQFWIGANFPGFLFINLFQENTLLYSSANFGNAGTGWFGGLVSDQPFDRAVIYRPNGSGVYIDDLFYSAVPAPGAFVLLGGILLCPRSRRRSDS